MKYTTARRAAEHALRRVFRRTGRDLRVRADSGRPEPSACLSVDDLTGPDDWDAGQALKALVEEEAVTCMDDLLLRRTDWGTNPRGTDTISASVTRVLGRQLPSRAVPDTRG